MRPVKFEYTKEELLKLKESQDKLLELEGVMYSKKRYRTIYWKIYRGS